MDHEHHLHHRPRRSRFFSTKTTDNMGFDSVSVRKEEQEALDKEIDLHAESWKLPFCIDDEGADPGVCGCVEGEPCVSGTSKEQGCGEQIGAGAAERSLGMAKGRTKCRI